VNARIRQLGEVADQVRAPIAIADDPMFSTSRFPPTRGPSSTSMAGPDSATTFLRAFTGAFVFVVTSRPPLLHEH
jgi:hypothetical protein